MYCVRRFARFSPLRFLNSKDHVVHDKGIFEEALNRITHHEALESTRARFCVFKSLLASA